MRRAAVRRSAWVLPALTLTACATMTKAPPPVVRTVGSVEISPEEAISTQWKTIIKEADTDRLARAKAAWDVAIAAARKAGFGMEMKAEGALLAPAGALPRAAPPPGPYRCRAIKLGAPGRGHAYVAYKSFECYVEAEGELLTIVKQTGSQRPAGRLWPDGDGRMIFLGANAIDEEHEPPAYGADAERDVVGYVERVAPFRWRMVMPWPHGDAKLDIIELVPIPPEPKPAA